MDEPCLMRQQKPLGESRVTEEEITSKNAEEIVVSPIHSESDSSHSDPLATSQRKPLSHHEISFSQTETYTNKENKDHPANIGDLEDIDLKPVEEVDESQIVTPCISEATAVRHSTKDNFVEKALSDLEESLRIPLRDIASSEANSLRLLTALNFLSHLSLKDVALPDGLQAVIDTMHTEFPTILCSFKQAFSITDKFSVTEAQQREEALKEQIIQLEKEVKCLQEEKEKCIQETIGYKMELENVMKNKYEIVEDQMKARQQIFEVDYKWSALLSQFQYNHIVARNPS